MIEARGLTKRYGDKVAVRDLSFTAGPDRSPACLGPNGAGNSPATATSCCMNSCSEVGGSGRSA